MPPRLTFGVLPRQLKLTRRERQIMDIVYRRQRATAAEVHAALPDAPSPTAVRTWLRILEEKGQLRHEKEGVRHVYMPVAPWAEVQRSAVKHLLNTIFGGSPSAVVSALLDVSAPKMTDAERAELRRLVDDARKKR